ncbi:MAG: macro domain-containing protein [Deltaproteobacteria bacterium]|nr:macro domain-containing protein [Deltaproteobacteria bacterium]
MLEHRTGNILQADAEALVNTVNCVGFMGKGIALQFKLAYPENYEAYRKACAKTLVKPGRMFVHETSALVGPRYIINFPTKRHWRGKSRMEDIQQGLEALVSEVRQRGITSIAVPPLGCGLGGLDWSEVRPLIERAFSALPDVRVLIYEPAQPPAPAARPVATRPPKMTPARALFIKAMDLYSDFQYRLTQLEIQKLAYFLQEAGEPLRLRFKAGHYGPYADNLNKVLERIEGHFTRGFTGSRSPDVEIQLLEGAADKAEAYLAEHEQSRQRLDRVAQLIEGFETPYGMELLASLHWVTAHQEPKPAGVDEAISRVHQWNRRKRDLLKPQHLRVAWQHLSDQQWL